MQQEHKGFQGLASCLPAWVHLVHWQTQRDSFVTVYKGRGERGKRERGTLLALFINQFKGVSLLESIRIAECLLQLHRGTNKCPLWQLPNNLGHCYWNGGQSKERERDRRGGESCKAAEGRESESEREINWAKMEENVMVKGATQCKGERKEEQNIRGAEER